MNCASAVEEVKPLAADPYQAGVIKLQDIAAYGNLPRNQLTPNEALALNDALAGAKQ